MKLNNKGFAISGVLYSLLILFVTLFIAILTILASTKFSLDKVKNDITNKLEDLIYRDTVLNGADPVLKEGMIPVTISADGTVRKADITKVWYDYDTKVWANAITVSQTNRSMYETTEPGTVIPESDILTYFVWIPRYRYKLWYVEATDGYSDALDTSKVHSIDIVFESRNTAKSNGSTNGTYLTHPAFTFGEEELNGIWVGKFETGYNGAATTTEAEIETADSTKVIIKPNVYSWRKMNISNMFSTSLNMNADNNVFGFTKESDTHMMKNTEWGAVVYLAFSDYGKDSNVYINNNSNHLTGCGGNSSDEAASSECLNGYGTKSNNIYSQSTTGNISGIFDMSGGASEHVMGYTIVYGSSGFTTETFPEGKYLTSYTSSNAKQYSNRILGDATGEMGPFVSAKSSWYNDYIDFIVSSQPWFKRGGLYNATTNAGIVNGANVSGAKNDENSFRIVLT